VEEEEARLQNHTFPKDRIENHYDLSSSHANPSDAGQNDFGHDVCHDDTIRCDLDDSQYDDHLYWHWHC
jgi:hypothetical protein